MARPNAGDDGLRNSVVGLVVLFTFSVVYPWWTLRDSALQGGVAALVGLVAWLRFGPPPIPGLLPGLLATTVLVSNLVVMGLAAWRHGAGA